jgi:hypothetical protein
MLRVNRMIHLTFFQPTVGVNLKDFVRSLMSQTFEQPQET